MATSPQNIAVPRTYPEDFFDVCFTAGWCECCDLALQAEQLGKVPTAQVWIWCVVFTLVFVVWRSLLQRMQNNVSAKINKTNVTAADYAVLVSNTGKTDSVKECLMDFARHYGQVLAAFPLVSVGDILTVCHKVCCPVASAPVCDIPPFSCASTTSFGLLTTVLGWHSVFCFSWILHRMCPSIMWMLALQ